MRHTTDPAVRAQAADFPAIFSPAFSLPAESVCVRSNGIEFQSAAAMPLWTELVIEVGRDAGDEGKICGLVVGCTGSVRTGHRVAVLFTGMGSVARARIEQICRAQRG
jgi:hypothetical protein